MKTLMELNPLTPLVLTARDLIVGQSPEYLLYYFGIMLACIPLFLVGLVFYRISIPIIVERMSA
jgi:lipopolysaccharide transport system permease protein